MTTPAEAYRLVQEGRAPEALAITTSLVEGEKPAHGALAAHAEALKALGRAEEAIAFQRRAADLYPHNGVAWHNLAATYADLSQGPAAKSAAERALAAGLDAPETWHVLGNAHMLLNEIDEAETAYREALARRPSYGKSAYTLASLVWTRRGQASEALRVIGQAREAGAFELPLILLEARMLESAGKKHEALAFLTAMLAHNPEAPELLWAAGRARFEQGDLAGAADLMLQAVQRGPGFAPALTGLAAVRLAQGRAREAMEAARRASDVDPLDQSTWGWLATAARAAGDTLYERLYDYGALVRIYKIATPVGWSSLDAYLGDLAATLRRLHLMNFAPSEQSVQVGTQTTTELSTCEEPEVRAFFQAIEGPVRAYMHELGAGEDPLRRRNTGRYRVQSAWSVLLRPGGFHTNHFHPEGWISSAFYVELPHSAMQREGREGWLKFGEPPYPTSPPQPPAHFVRPEPGLLALFPSYMWHGTVPFQSDERRLTIASDFVPRDP